MNGIKHARQKRHGHDDKTLEGRHLVKLFRPQASHQSHGAQQTGAQNGKRQDPQRRLLLKRRKPNGDGKNTQADSHAAQHG